MKQTYKGMVWKYGDDINTDVIFPGKYTYQKMEPAEMARHALEDLDPDFASRVSEGDILVAGKNFGMGSSREQAAVAIRHAGVSVIIARSFARIFFRNSINAGMPALACPDAVDALERGDRVEVDMARGLILTPRGRFEFPPYPAAVVDILEAGGLIPWVRLGLKNE